MKRNLNISAFFRDLFFVQTECVLSFAIVGTIFAREAAISYAYFFIPLVMGALCMVPCLPVYLIENMSIPQVIVQRSVELVVLEAACVWTANFLAGDFLGMPGLVAVAALTALLDVLSYSVAYWLEKAESERLNKKLREAADKSDTQKAGGENGAKDSTIEAFGDQNRRAQIPIAEILYFEADAEQVFAYTEKEIFQVRQRLYQVETLGGAAGIIRVSKSHLVNVRKIQSVRTALNSRLYAKMANGEEVLVSRKYAPNLKERIS
ncbi:MAG: LytTR family transcriptional regulator [Treponema sp.]|nr:LytTR family transcriptional regulator [Treponema sp.]